MILDRNPSHWPHPEAQLPSVPAASRQGGSHVSSNVGAAIITQSLPRVVSAVGVNGEDGYWLGRKVDQVSLMPSPHR